MNKLIDALKKIENVPYISLNGIKTFAKVVNVKDGDTLELIIPSFSSYYKYVVRLQGIDTCETRCKNNEIKELGEKAKYRVLELLTNNKYVNLRKKDIKNIFQKENVIVRVECYEFDKYGRLLANVFLYDDKIDKNSISNILILEKLAYKYDGGTKLSEDDQINMMN